MPVQHPNDKNNFSQRLSSLLSALVLTISPIACQKTAVVPAPAQNAKPAPHFLMAESVGVLPTIADDPGITAAIAPKQAEIKATFDLPLCACPKGLFRGRNGEENLLGYWVADTMRARASRLLRKPVKFAMTNSGGLRSNLSPGTLKVADIYGVMPFENELITMEMTGQEVLDAVKQGFLHRGGEPSSGVKLLVSGTVEKPEYLITWEDGAAIQPDEIVLAATTDYLFNNGDSTPALKKGRHPFTTGLALRQVLLDACGDLAKANQPLIPPAVGRYTSPPDLYAAARDHKLGK